MSPSATSRAVLSAVAGAWGLQVWLQHNPRGTTPPGIRENGTSEGRSDAVQGPPERTHGCMEIA